MCVKKKVGDLWFQIKRQQLFFLHTYKDQQFLVFFMWNICKRSGVPSLFAIFDTKVKPFFSPKKWKKIFLKEKHGKKYFFWKNFFSLFFAYFHEKQVARPLSRKKFFLWKKWLDLSVKNCKKTRNSWSFTYTCIHISHKKDQQFLVFF